MLRTVLLAAALLPASVAAQEATADSVGMLRLGDRVHVVYRGPDGSFTRRAQFMAGGNDSITLEMGGQQRTLALRDVQRLSLHAGEGSRRRSATVGAAVGLGVGALAVAFDQWAGWPRTDAGNEYRLHCSEEIGYYCWVERVSLGYSVVRGAGILSASTLAGALIGSAMPPVRWRRLSLVPAADPPGNGPALSLEVRPR